MNIDDGIPISAAEAVSFLTPRLAGFLKGRDLGIALDHELGLGDKRNRSCVLLLPAGVSIEGDLVLDHGETRWQGQEVRGIIAEGDLAFSGDILNDGWDGGPFLVCLGNLSLRHVLKCGAPVLVCGSLTASGSVVCSYNHGSFRAFGGLSARELIVDDHHVEVAGQCDAARFDLRMDDPGRFLAPEFVMAADASGDVYPVDNLNDLMRAAVLAGRRILRPDVPKSV